MASGNELHLRAQHAARSDVPETMAVVQANGDAGMGNWVVSQWRARVKLVVRDLPPNKWRSSSPGTRIVPYLKYLTIS